MDSMQRGQNPPSVLSRLSPQVFSHPVWAHFIENGPTFSPNLLKNLLKTVEQLQQNGELNCTCQTLFICTYLQNRLDDQIACLHSIQQILSLADEYGLSEIIQQALWGNGALCTQWGDLPHAAEQLHYLAHHLTTANEWILANIVEVVSQTLRDCDCGTCTLIKEDSTSSLMTNTMFGKALDYLLHWGEPPYMIEAIHTQTITDQHGNNVPTSILPSLLSIQNWRLLWQIAKRMVKGEFQLTLVEEDRLGSSTDIHVNRPQLIVSGTDYSLTTQIQSSSQDVNYGDESLPSPSVTGTKLSSIDAMPSLVDPTQNAPTLVVHCLGTFRVYRNHEIIERWFGQKAKSIFKYLVTHREYSVNRDILIELFWDEIDPATSRKNLHQAIYNLRQTLQGKVAEFPYILLEDGCYCLNPDLTMWIDSETFLTHYQTGQRLERQGRIAEAVAEYESAECLYEGDFLIDDLYEDWPIVQRESLKHAYLDTLDKLSRYYFDRGLYSLCIAYSQKILSKDNCREDAQRRLMRCYVAQGQPYLALRQYHQCVEALALELDVPPMPATVELFQEIQENRVQFSTS